MRTWSPIYSQIVRASIRIAVIRVWCIFPKSQFLSNNLEQIWYDWQNLRLSHQSYTTFMRRIKLDKFLDEKRLRNLYDKAHDNVIWTSRTLTRASRQQPPGSNSSLLHEYPDRRDGKPFKLGITQFRLFSFFHQLLDFSWSDWVRHHRRGVIWSKTRIGWKSDEV